MTEAWGSYRHRESRATSGVRAFGSAVHSPRRRAPCGLRSARAMCTSPQPWRFCSRSEQQPLTWWPYARHDARLLANGEKSCSHTPKRGAARRQHTAQPRVYLAARAPPSTASSASSAATPTTRMHGLQVLSGPLSQRRPSASAKWRHGHAHVPLDRPDRRQRIAQ
eukprot:scaffold221251_cov32-Tisochrysis_lutea.AAC.6